MADLLIKRLQEALTRQRFNYKSLSVASGLGETTVRDIITGRARNPRRDTLQKIAYTLGLPLSYFLTEEAPGVFAEEAGRHERPSGSLVREAGSPAAECETVELPPEAGYPRLAAVRLKGMAMLPFLPEGSILYYQKPHRGVEEDCLGKLCVVARSDGMLGVYVVERGLDYGRYRLKSYNAGIAEEAELAWCARVLFIKPA